MVVDCDYAVQRAQRGWWWIAPMRFEGLTANGG